MRYKWIKNNTQSMNAGIQKLLEENKISKTSWAADWLRFYFCCKTGLKGRPEELERFLREIEKPDRKECIKNSFERDFPELGELMNMICRMVAG